MAAHIAVTPPPKTVLEVITATKNYFEKSGIENARLNIEHLLAHVLGKRRMDLYMEFDRVLSETELTPLRDLVRRRASGEPLQHLLGTVEFLGLTLKCDARALIPRPETEQLCEMLVADAKRDGCIWKTHTLVDVGTGSGCIALALAASLPELRAIGLEHSEHALALAMENAAHTAMTARVTFQKSDLLSTLTEPVALIVANLPYIATHEVAALQGEVLRDPVAALDGGADGLAIIRRLLAEAPSRLIRGGRLALEIGYDQGAPLLAALRATPFADARILKDHQGRDRYLFATHG